jgi:hypothetical protein
MFENKLDRIRRDHEFKMEKLKLLGELQIEESKVKNNISLNKLSSEKSQLHIVGEIRELKTIVKQDKSTIKAGKLLNMWGTLGTVISTLLTIAGLWSFFSSSYLKAISFILAIVMTQFTVFILAKQDTNIKKHFMHHAFKASMLKVVLLSISIYGNYTFFATGRAMNFPAIVTTLALCIAIDVISIYCISIAQDFRTLNKNVSKDSLYTGLLGKVIFNMTYKVVSVIENKYHSNKKGLTLVKDRNKEIENIKELEYKKDTEIEENQENNSNIDMDRNVNEELENNNDSKVLEMSDFVQDKDRGLIKSTILNYQDNNICPSTSALMDLTGLSKNKIIAVKKELETDGMIETVGNKTFLKSVEV